MKTAQTIKNISAYGILILGFFKVLLIVLTQLGVAFPNAATYEIMQGTNMLKGPAATIWLNALTAFIVVVLLVYVARKNVKLELCIAIGALAALNLGIYTGKLYTASGISFATVVFGIYTLVMVIFAFSTYMQVSQDPNRKRSKGRE